MAKNESKTSLDRRSRIVLFFAVVAFTFVLASIWTERNAASGLPESIVNFTRLVTVLTCFAVAFLFRSYLPSVYLLCKAGLVCFVVQGVLYIMFLARIPSAEGYVPVGYLSGLFGGACHAFVILAIAHLISAYPLRATAIAVPVSFLLNELLYSVLQFVPYGVLVILRPSLMLLGLLLTVGCLRANERNRNVDGGVHRVQCSIAPAAKNERVFSFLETSQEWALLLIGTTLFPFIFGAVSQVSVNGYNVPGLYDVSNEIVAVGALFLLVVYGFVRGAKLSYDEVLGWSIPLFATGCLMLPVFTDANGSTAGILVKLGYTLYQTMFWMLLTRKAHQDPRHTYLYFGIFYGLFELATLVARFSMGFLLLILEPSIHVTTGVALVSLWLIGLYGLFFFLISKRWALRKTEGADDPDVRIRDPFEVKFEAFCAEHNVSDREREVLTEAIHGYSMDNIGKRLYITRNTVKTHLQRIYRKTGVSSKQEIIAMIDGDSDDPRGVLKIG